MKAWGSALFPLSIMLVLTALTFWLRYATELPETRHDGKFRHDPDYIVNQSTLRKMDENGWLSHVITSSEIRHYPDDDSTELLAPEVAFLKRGKPPLTLRADRGHLTRDNEQVDLVGNVFVRRAGSATDPEMTARTDTLTVLPDEDRAYTRAPVRFTQGNSRATAVGMQIDNRARTYLLESQVRAEMESKRSKKKP